MSVKTDPTWQKLLADDVDGSGGKLATVTEVADSLGDPNKGEKDCALYQLANGRFCLVVVDQKTHGVAYHDVPDRARAEQIATAIGMGVRLGKAEAGLDLPATPRVK